ncbi:hypothetical protein AVEN_132285-1 [Araneus ventricosus]|uniref:Transposase Tc1-like domain-containing protein n=1 Tax=Araneus ventricosus TaxID=182803 RepID=A0A4Y2UFK7_ARAVE|nr:hypothetical protein AVEN_132285-1 [Araneus ventricosus]
MKISVKSLINRRLQYNILLKDTVSFKNLRRDRSQTPPKLNHLHQRNIMDNAQDNPRISDPRVAADLKADYNVQVKPQTVRNLIIKTSYNGRAVRKTPCINLCNEENASS